MLYNSAVCTQTNGIPITSSKRARTKFILTTGLEWIFGFVENQPNETGERVYRITKTIRYNPDESKVDTKKTRREEIVTYLKDYVEWHYTTLYQTGTYACFLIAIQQGHIEGQPEWRNTSL